MSFPFLWQLLMLSHLVLFFVSLMFLAKLKTSLINKILWVIITFFFLIAGSVCFLVWRRSELKKQEEETQ